MSSIDILRCGLKNLDNQRAEAVRTVLTLSCYTLDKDDPFLQNLDSTLTTFRWNERVLGTKNMRETRITSYFNQQ
jgi:hypothetical protein